MAMAALIALMALCAAAWPQDAGSESAAAEQELFRMTNRDRAEAGLPELEWNEWLAQAARKHAAEMARRGRLSHQFPGEPGLRDRIAATSIRFRRLGGERRPGADHGGNQPRLDAFSRPPRQYP